MINQEKNTQLRVQFYLTNQWRHKLARSEIARCTICGTQQEIITKTPEDEESSSTLYCKKCTTKTGEPAYTEHKVGSNRSLINLIKAQFIFGMLPPKE